MRKLMLLLALPFMMAVAACDSGGGGDAPPADSAPADTAPADETPAN